MSALSTSHWIVVPWDAAPRLEPVPERTLSALQGHVGGFVEVVSLYDAPVAAVDLWVNEEYAFLPPVVDLDDAEMVLPVNVLATALARTWAPRTLLAGGVIKGGAVIASVGADGETVGVPDELVDALHDAGVEIGAPR